MTKHSHQQTGIPSEKVLSDPGFGVPTNFVDRPAPDGQQAAQARAVVDAEKAQRAEQCRVEIMAVLAKHRCQAQFIEVRVNGQTQQMSLQIVALD